MGLLRFKVFCEEYYYHGTSKEHADNILKHGIDPSHSKYGTKTYLTKNHGEASKYAKIASGGKPGVVIKVHKDHLHPDHIAHDHSGIVQYAGKVDSKHISRV